MMQARGTLWSQSTSTVQKGVGSQSGRQKSSAAQNVLDAQELGAPRQSSRQRPSTQWVPAPHIAELVHSLAGRQKPRRQLSPSAQSVSEPQIAAHSLFTQAEPAAHSRSNWQVSPRSSQRPSTQTWLVEQSDVPRHAPGSRGTQVPRKSHQNDASHALSPVQAPEGAHVASLQYSATGQSPFVRQLVGPATQTLSTQRNPLLQSTSREHSG
jgi:hypothetical protein